MADQDNEITSSKVEIIGGNEEDDTDLEQIESEQDNETSESNENEFEIELPDSDSPPEQTVNDNSTIREMRAALREKDEELKRLRGNTQPVTQLPVRPTMESCGYDEDVLQAELDKWFAQKSEYETTVKAQEAAQQRQQQRQQQAWDNYRQSQANLKAPDFKAKEFQVESALPEQYQQLLVSAASDSGKMVYILGSKPELLKELTKLAHDDDAIGFIKTVAKLEEKPFTVKSRQTVAKPVPDSSPRGGASVGNGGNKLEELREKARKTGDMSELIAYKKQLKQKA